MDRENVILIDWLSFTTTKYCPEELIEAFGLNGVSWQLTFGTRGYQSRYYFSGISIQFGSQKSDALIRIYDKLAERLSKIRNETEKEKVKNAIPQWLRIELQLRDERAYNFIRYMILDKLPIGEVYSGVVRNYLEFGSFYLNKDNKKVFKPYSYWNEFLSNSEKLKLFVSPVQDYNLENCVNYVQNCAGNAVACLMEIYGKHFEKLIERRKIAPNPKYQEIINKYNNKKQKEN